jgi:hypothetical protein
MAIFIERLAALMAASPLHELAQHLLLSVWGLTPAIQTIHILSIAAIMGSAVPINLRVLGLAFAQQPIGEMVPRLMKWTWFALPVLFVTGSVFVFFRPGRYLDNPVFLTKMTLLVPAVMLTAVLHLGCFRTADYWESSLLHRRAARTIAVASLALWVTITLAGRWIAYSYYLFPD